MFLRRLRRLGLLMIVGALELTVPLHAGSYHHLRDRSVTNWLEDAGPFPFGVYAIAQDREGYLWLGTRTGLIRFDGSTFTQWKGSQDLTDDRISRIFASSDGSLWVGYGAASGVTRIQGSTVRNFGVLDGVSSGQVNDLIEDSRGVLWASTREGLSRFEHGRWTALGKSAGLPPEPIFGMFYDSRGNYWVSTSAGIYRSSGDANHFKLFAQVSGKSFAEDTSGTVWITNSQSGFLPLDGKWKSERKLVNWKGALGFTILRDHTGSLWVGTRGHGIMRISGLDGDGASVSQELLTTADNLPTNEIRSMFEDRDGTLWVGSRLGLSRVSKSNIQVVLGAWRGDTFVEAVAATRDGSVWAATAQGLHRRVGDRVRTYGTAEGLPAQVVTSLHEDHDGTLWVATSDGVARLESGRFVPAAESSGVKLRGVQSMATDLSGAMWLCDVQGLFKWEHSRLTRVVEAKREGRPYVAYADSVGRVWVGFWIGGIVMFEKGQVASFGRDDGLPDGTVNVVYEDSRGIVWVGTSRGLVRFEGGRFVPLSRNGFPEEAVVSMIEDDQHNLWVGLASSLVRIEREEVARLVGKVTATLYYRTFGREDGLPGTLGRPGMPSSTLDAGGRLWFVTSVGLVVIDPNHLTATPTRGPLRVDELVADGRTYALSGRPQLPAGTSRIQIDYSVLSLAAGGRPRFRYRLNRFDSDWQDAGERRQASYTNLPPGDYSFQVASNDTEGDRAGKVAVLTFSIQPAFYQTGTFYTACVGLVLLSVWSAWRLRLRRVHHQFELVLAERVRMGREIHDTLLQSLVGVALEFDDISEQLDPSAQSLGMQVRRIRQQVEYYIREARQSIWNLRSPMCQSGDLPSALRHFGETVTAGHFQRFEFKVSGPSRRSGARADEQLLRIGQEALMNAVRHSGASRITAELRYSPDVLSLSVSDDGCGFEQDQADNNSGVHWGMTSMRERAQQIGATFRLTTVPGVGTTIETIVPFPRE